MSSDKKYGATDYQIHGIYVEELVIGRKVHERPEVLCNLRTCGRRKRYRPCRRCHTPCDVCRTWAGTASSAFLAGSIQLNTIRTASRCRESRAQTDQRGGRELIEAVLIGWLGLGVRRKSEVEQMFQPLEFGVFCVLILFCFFTTAFPLAAAAP